MLRTRACLAGLATVTGLLALSAPALAIPRSISWVSPPAGGPFAAGAGVNQVTGNAGGDVCGSRREAARPDQNPIGAASSTDGSHVFFTTSDRLVSSDTDGRPDVYEHFNGQTRLVSTGSVFGEAPEAYLMGCSTDGSRAVVVLFQRPTG